MFKLKVMTIVTNDFENLKNGYYADAFSNKILVDLSLEQAFEITIDKIITVSMGTVHVMYVHEKTSPKDLIGYAKMKHHIDVIVLDNAIHMMNEKYLEFDDVQDLINFIETKQQNINLSDTTADAIRLAFEQNQLDSNKITNLYELLNDRRILPIDIQEAFIF